MEFNILQHFKGLEHLPMDPFNGDEIGTSLFLTGNMGPKISAKMDGYAKQAGMSRRNFLKSSLGFSAAMLAANEVTGMKFFEVGAAEAADVDAKNEAIQLARASSDFIVDVHTHVCTRPGHYVEGVNTTTRGMWFVQLLDDLGKAFGLPNGTRDMNVENYGKLILKESDTTVGIFNPFGFREDYGGQDMIPMDYQVAGAQQLAESTRSCWPAASRRTRAWRRPSQRLHEVRGDLQDLGPQAVHLRLDQEEGLVVRRREAAPTRCGKSAASSGIKNIGCHKGIPFGQFYARYAHVEDFDATADDFLDLNFIAYHSAWPYHNELAALKGFKPQRKNLYCEVGSTFAATVTSRPMECAHVLGTLLRDLGPDYVLWGTDSLLWGNPQWQIDAFRKFQIPDQLVEGHGYPKITPEIRRKVFGENAARIWNIDKQKAMQAKAEIVSDQRSPERRSAAAFAGADSSRGRPRLLGNSRRAQVPFYEYACDPVPASSTRRATGSTSRGRHSAPSATAGCAR